MAYNYLDKTGLALVWEKIKNALTGKVDKIDGKGLSTNDYTSDEKTKLAGIETGAQVNVLEGVQVNGTDITSTNKIANIPVPTKTSDLTNDSNFVSSDSVPTNWVNGSATGSVRTVKSKTENSSYTMGEGAVAEGGETRAVGKYSHAEGSSSLAEGRYSHAEGTATTAKNESSHAEGGGSTASGANSHAEGGGSTASGNSSHAEGGGTTASGSNSHAEGGGSKAIGDYSHAEGNGTTAEGGFSHTEGAGTKAQNAYSHAEGLSTTASGEASHTEGKTTTASGEASHAEGYQTTASNYSSHAEGAGTTASGNYSHAEGAGTKAIGARSHAEGSATKADGENSHAEGAGTIASGSNSHAEGGSTIAKGDCQHVFGQFNIEDANSTYAEIVGNGDSTTRSNARTLDWDGNEVLTGKLTVGTVGSDSMDVATIGQLPTSTSQLTNDSGFQTATDVSNAIASSLTTVMDYKGTVATVAELPATDNKNGDVYHVTADNGEYAWDGTKWEPIGGAVDMSGYVEDTDMSAITSTEINTICV